MKKKIILIVLALIVCLSLCGCNKMFGRLDDLCKDPHENVKLTVNVTDGNVELKGTYAAVKQADGSVSVQYSYQVLNEIITDNGSYEVPGERITTYSGSMKITSVDGVTQVETQDGAKPNLDLTQITAVALNFNKSNLDKVEDKDGVFSANVKDLSKLMGSDTEGQNGRVVAKYTEDAIQSVEISFERSGYQVVFTYDFTA